MGGGETVLPAWSSGSSTERWRWTSASHRSAVVDGRRQQFTQTYHGIWLTKFWLERVHFGQLQMSIPAPDTFAHFADGSDLPYFEHTTQCFKQHRSYNITATPFIPVRTLTSGIASKAGAVLYGAVFLTSRIE